jgi:uncharacterized protein YcnI
MKTKLPLAVILVSLVVPASASAHVTIKPDGLPAGGYTRIDVRVPNESDTASTDKVEVQMPDGFAAASYEPVPGWETVVKTSKLDEPVETVDGEITEQVDTISWTAAEGNNGIAPGQFQDFGLSVKMPDSPGETLTFPAVQSYTDSEVVRWIGAPDSEEPAPTVTLGEPAEEGHAATETGSDEAGAEEGTAMASGGDNGGLVLGALIVAILALILSAVSLMRRR